MKSLLDLIKALYGPKAISSTIGTRTNVIRLPSGKLQKYLSKELNIEAASDNAAQNAYNEMKELLPEVAKMNDAERLVFEGNLRRLKNKLEASGLIQGENVSSGITALESKVEQLKQKGKELEKVTGEKATLTDVLNDLGASQQSMSRLNDEGLVRSTAREILINDIKAGKIKNITVSEAITRLRLNNYHKHNIKTCDDQVAIALMDLSYFAEKVIKYNRSLQMIIIQPSETDANTDTKINFLMEQHQSMLKTLDSQQKMIDKLQRELNTVYERVIPNEQSGKKKKRSRRNHRAF
jgi:hypothetical protein